VENEGGLCLGKKKKKTLFTCHKRNSNVGITEQKGTNCNLAEKEGRTVIP